MLSSRYCANPDCPQDRWFSFNEDYCSMCREETTPCIRCLCGDDEYHPKATNHPACDRCGERWTPDYLALCMSVQLKGMVREISEKYTTLS